jgi:hypothetical protein
MFVVSTWSASYKKSRSAGIIHTDDWPAIMHPQINKILDRDGARCLIAYEHDDPDYFYGWIAGDTSERVPVVYYVYVKAPYRRSGIAGRLFGALGVDPKSRFVYVCSTLAALQLSEKIPYALWNPLEVRYPKESRRHHL